MTVLAFSDYLENKIIDHLLRAQAHTPTATVYLGIYSTATDDAAGGTEATGSGYARQAITFAVPALGASSNTNTLSYTMPVGTWTHVAIHDALTAGNRLAWGELTTPRTTTLAQGTQVAAGEITLGATAACNATDFLRGLIINRFFRNQAHTPGVIKMALYTSATSRTGGGTEVTGGAYIRQSVTLNAGAAGVTANANAVDFVMPLATATHAALHNVAGDMYLESALTAPVAAAAGDIIRIPTGDYDLVVT